MTWPNSVAVLIQTAIHTGILFASINWEGWCLGCPRLFYLMSHKNFITFSRGTHHAKRPGTPWSTPWIDAFSWCRRFRAWGHGGTGGLIWGTSKSSKSDQKPMVTWGSPSLGNLWARVKRRYERLPLRSAITTQNMWFTACSDRGPYVAIPLFRLCLWLKLPVGHMTFQSFDVRARHWSSRSGLVFLGSCKMACRQVYMR